LGRAVPPPPVEEVAVGFGVAVPPVVIGPVPVPVGDEPALPVAEGPKVGEPERSEISAHSLVVMMYSKSLGRGQRH